MLTTKSPLCVGGADRESRARSFIQDLKHSKPHKNEWVSSNKLNLQHNCLIFFPKAKF